MKGLVMEREKIVFKFDGDLEEISVETFTTAVMSYTKLLQMAATEINPSSRLDVRISGTQKGCFEAHLSAVAMGVGSMMANLMTSAGQVNNAISTVKSFLELRRFLAKGGAPKEIRKDGQQIQVLNNSGTMTVGTMVINLEANDEAVKSAKGMYRTLAENEAVEGFKVTGSNGESFESERAEFDELQEVPRCEVESTREVMWEGKTLAVVCPVLAPTERKWQFIMGGFKVSAIVSDQEMYSKLSTHEWSFGIGDSIKADLEVTQRRVKDDVWENTSYRVVKVHDVISSPRDQRLFE